MSLVLTSTPVVGLPALTGWAQVVHNHSGQLVCAYAVSGQNAHNLGRDLADFITAVEPTDAVTLHQLILDLLARTRKAGSGLQFAAILQANEHLVVGALQGQVLYHRDGTTRSLVQAEAEPQLLEGKLVADTTLVALTHQATAHSELLTQQLTQGWDADTIITSLLPSLHDQPDSALSALAFVKVAGEKAELATAYQAEIIPDLPPLPFTAAEPKPSLAPSRRTVISVPRLTVQFTALSHLITTGSHRFRHLTHRLSQSWHQTLPKAKQQLIGASIVVTVIISLILASLIGFINTKKSAHMATTQQAQSTEASSTTSNQSQELPVFFDLRLTEPNFLANKMIVTDTTAYFTDLDQKKIIQLDVSKKQSNLLPLGTVSKITDLSVSGQFLYLLGGGLSRWEIQPTSTTTPPPIKTLKTEGDSDRDGTLLGSFGSYLYVLNPTKRNIFRFAVDKQDKVSEPIGWLVNKKGLDFPQLISLAIDGDVWLTSKTGQVFKFTQGQPVTWQLSNIKTPPDSPIYAVTNNTLTKLYLLEPKRHRLLIVDKAGQLVKEIESPTLAAATSFGVSESVQKAFAVSGSTVYEIAL